MDANVVCIARDGHAACTVNSLLPNQTVRKNILPLAPLTPPMANRICNVDSSDDSKPRPPLRETTVLSIRIKMTRTRRCPRPGKYLSRVPREMRINRGWIPRSVAARFHNWRGRSCFKRAFLIHPLLALLRSHRGSPMTRPVDAVCSIPRRLGSRNAGDS